MGVGAVLCERPAAGVLDGAPRRAAVAWVAPALVMGGRGSTRQTDLVGVAAWGRVFLRGKGGAFAEVEPLVRPGSVWHIQKLGSQRWAHCARWRVN